MPLRKTVVIDVVGLSRRLIHPSYTPFLHAWAEKRQVRYIEPTLPAVTCTAQATYLTGKQATEHGIVGNGWYFKEECEVKFWRQSNKLVQAEKIWETLRRSDPGFTAANLFWWYNMYSTVDYSVTPRPNYLANGLKIPDVYSYPAELRDRLQEKLGTFPLFKFWGPATDISSSKWIADAAKLTETWHQPDLMLIYLPHLDYNIQRHGHNWDILQKDLREIDKVCSDLISFFEDRGAEVVVLSEYGITDVHRPVHLNRVLREAGLLQIRREQTWELLDAGASPAFAVADHQIAHVYLNDPSRRSQVRELLEKTPGVEHVYEGEARAQVGLHHSRAGDFVVVADADSWFTYYYWLDDAKAPDFARIVDIHRKPGYDPVEMFVDPKIKLPMLKIGATLARKKLGFRYLMDVIPLDATLVKGSHGRRPEDQADWPVLIGGAVSEAVISATQVHKLLLTTIGV